MRTMLLISTVLAATSLSLALPALADEAEDSPGMMTGQGCGSMMGPGMMGRHHMMGRHGWRMEAEVQARLAYLKAELEITDAQAEAWKGYADVVAGQTTAMQTAHKAVGDASENGGALERLDARISGMEAMLQSLKSKKPAVEKLYGVLTDDQQKLADDLIGVGCGAMEPKRPRRPLSGLRRTRCSPLMS